MLEQVRLCAAWPMENWLGSSLNQIQGWTAVRESYSCALEQGLLTGALLLSPLPACVCAGKRYVRRLTCLDEAQLMPSDSSPSCACVFVLSF